MNNATVSKPIQAIKLRPKYTLFLYLTSGVLVASLLLMLVLRLVYPQSTPEAGVEAGEKELIRARGHFGMTRKQVYESFVAADLNLDRLEVSTNNVGLQGLIEVIARDESLKVDAMMNDPETYPEYQGRTRQFVVAAEQNKVLLELYRLSLGANPDMRLCSVHCQTFSSAQNVTRLVMVAAAYDLVFTVRAVDPKSSFEILRAIQEPMSDYYVARNELILRTNGQAEADLLDEWWRKGVDEINATRGAQQ